MQGLIVPDLRIQPCSGSGKIRGKSNFNLGDATMRLGKSAWAALFAGAAVASLTPAAEEGWTKLFNGNNLDGWVQRNGTATYCVEDGVVVGKTNEGSPNSFLCTEKNYGDFELKFEVKVADELNSGVQIRSHSKDDFNK